MTRRPSRYSAVAIALHWLIAIAILSMIPMGWWMSEAINEPGSQALAYRVFQIHKSVGFLILALTALRLVWRLTHRTPGMPAEAEVLSRPGQTALKRTSEKVEKLLARKQSEDSRAALTGAM